MVKSLDFSKIGFVKSSTIRLKILNELSSQILIPSEIANLTSYNLSQVSKAISDLEKNGLVVCLNKEVHKGRFYKISFEGEEILNFLNHRDIKVSAKNTLIKRNNNRKSISPKIRSKVLRRDHYTCNHCGKSIDDGAKLEVDHIVPVSKGGTNDLNNLQVLCWECNHGKSNNFIG